MKQQKNKYLIIILITLFLNLLLSRVTITHANDQTDEINTAIVNTIYQIKNVLMNHSSPNDIERMIKQSNEMGGKGFKIARSPAYPIVKDMGWLLEDSKGREVFRVYFTFINNKAADGRYLGPVISNAAKEGAAQAMLSMHRDALSKNLRPIGTDKYDLGNGCFASLTLFKNNAAPGRTIISVACN